MDELLTYFEHIYIHTYVVIDDYQVADITTVIQVNTVPCQFPSGNCWK